MVQRALLLINRHSRQGEERLSEAIACLRANNFDLIEDADATCETYNKAIDRYKDQVDLIIVGGGDGTLNAIVDAVVESGLPLGILPLGTANDLARTLRIPTNLQQACQVIQKGRLQAIDLGWVNGKHFFNVASLGLSVQITRQLDKKLKRRLGALAYAFTAIRVMLKTRLFTARIRVNGDLNIVRTVQIAVGNGRHYGGGLTVAADATIDDQRLDVYSLELKHWWQIIPLLPAMRLGTFESWSFMHTYQGQEVEIITPRPYQINTDGEITTSTPALFRVIPKALSVFVPDEETPNA